MLSAEEKKEAIRQYKERKPAAGIYAVRCPATGRAWVGASRNLDATRNGLWFSLRAGVHRDTTLQREWTARGESAFHYEPLETLPDDTPALSMADRLKERRLYWMSTLSADGLL